MVVVRVAGGNNPPPVVPPPVTRATITFSNASVHDPSVIKVGAEYYVFGSHLAAAKSTDLMNWTLIADGVTNTNPLFTNVLTALQPTFAWSQVNDLWAPDVVQAGRRQVLFLLRLLQGRFAAVGTGCRGGDSVNGPYVNKADVPEVRHGRA